MEAIMVPYSPDQSISPYNNKNMRNPNRNRNSRHFVSRSIGNFAPKSAIHNHNGLLFAPPPPLSYSFPPPTISLVNSNQPQHQQQQHYKKPPLLPLPITKPYASSLPSRTRGLSCSPSNNKSFNRSIKKSKPSSSTSPKKEDSKKDSNSSNANTKDVSECLIIASTNRLGPDPNDLPKDVSRVLSSSSSSSAAAAAVDGVITCKVLVDLEKFSGSVFTLSPPPSSLPLPKFSLRPKLGCNVEADGFDAGATDNLRRLLRLH